MRAGWRCPRWAWRLLHVRTRCRASPLGAGPVNTAAHQAIIRSKEHGQGLGAAADTWSTRLPVRGARMPVDLQRALTAGLRARSWRRLVVNSACSVAPGRAPHVPWPLAEATCAKHLTSATNAPSRGTRPSLRLPQQLCSGWLATGSSPWRWSFLQLARRTERLCVSSGSAANAGFPSRAPTPGSTQTRSSLATALQARRSGQSASLDLNGPRGKVSGR